MLKLSISNIAWNVADDDKVAELLVSLNVSYIDTAPGKYFSDIKNVKNEEIIKVRQWWQDRNIQFAGMQSLLFGTTGLNLFEIQTQQPMLHHLEKVCHIGSLLGATRLVFGSPKNRDRSKLDDNSTKDTALDFFNKLGNIAKSEGVIICLEANPVCYGTNFLTTTKETAEFVKELNHKNIRLQLDMGTVYTNHEDFSDIEKYAELIGHIHLSESNLAKFNSEQLSNDQFHIKCGEEFKKLFSNSLLKTDIATIEMLIKDASSTDDYLQSISSAVEASRKIYGVEN